MQASMPSRWTSLVSAAQTGAETDPARLIGLAVAQLRTQHERCGDIITAIRSGASADPTLAEVWDEGTRRYDDACGTWSAS
jgi:hypothetical protein